MEKESPQYILRGIYVRESQLFMKDDFDPLSVGSDLVGKFRIISQNVSLREEITENEEKNIYCAFTTHFQFGYSEENINNEVEEAELDPEFLTSISLKISVDYKINNGISPSQEDIQKWGTTNVLLHSWPYWREYCHSMQMRMNIPTQIIPLWYFPLPSDGKPPESD